MVSHGVTVELVTDDMVSVVNGNTVIDIKFALDGRTSKYYFALSENRVIRTYITQGTALEDILETMVMVANIADDSKEDIKNVLAVQLSHLAWV